VPRVDYDKLMTASTNETSATIRERVIAARGRQTARFRDEPAIHANSDMGVGQIQQYCILKDDARQLLELSVRRLQLSARSYHRVLKLARTIADLADSERIEIAHVAEAIQYRPRLETG